MGARDPEKFGIDGNIFFNGVLLDATLLAGIAETQHEQDPDPDARLAVHCCLHAATLRIRSGLPFVPEPQRCIVLVKVASRVMASFAAAHEAASAASVLLPPISNFLTAMAGQMHRKSRNPLGIGRKLAGARRSLIASVQVVLEGPSPLLSAAGVTARGPALVLGAAWSVLCALNIAVLVPESEISDSLMAVQLLKQCRALLADHESVAKLQGWQHYPQCFLAYDKVLRIAAQLALVANAAFQLNLTFLRSMLKVEQLPAQQYRIGTLADCQQQLLALSNAVAQPSGPRRMKVLLC